MEEYGFIKTKKVSRLKKIVKISPECRAIAYNLEKIKEVIKNAKDNSKVFN